MNRRLLPLVVGAAIVIVIVLADWFDGGVESWRPAPAVQTAACIKVDLKGNIIGRCIPDETRCRLKVDGLGNIIGRSAACPPN